MVTVLANKRWIDQSGTGSLTAARASTVPDGSAARESALEQLAGAVQCGPVQNNTGTGNIVTFCAV